MTGSLTSCDACNLMRFLDYSLLSDQQRVNNTLRAFAPLASMNVIHDGSDIPDDQEIWEAFEADLECSVDCSLCGDRGCGSCR